MEHVQSLLKPLLKNYGYEPERMIVIAPDDMVPAWDRAVRHFDKQTAFVIPAVLAFHPGGIYQTIRERLVTQHHLLGIVYVPGDVAEQMDSVYVVIAEPQKGPPNAVVPIIRVSDNTTVHVSKQEFQYWRYNFSFYCYYRGDSASCYSRGESAERSNTHVP